tara:strand:- start:1272 stop:2096 length:825 start_codon:yes stop_codon:yes gene_type:complete
MKKILFPTDFSENSEQAFPYALDLAYLLNAELTIFNAYKLPYSKSNLLVSIGDRMQIDSQNSLEELKKGALDQEKYKHLTINTLSLAGGFVSQIPKVARDDNSNIIVMGTKGATGLKEMFIGSNTLEVIQITHCPVLAVPQNATNAKVNKIAMATDLKKVNDVQQLEPLFEMARICRASIEFVNIISSDGTLTAEQRSKQMMLLDEMAGDIKTTIYFATNNDIIEGLSDYMTLHKPGMFAMLARKHSLFERIFSRSITNKLSVRTDIPLLVLDE